MGWTEEKRQRRQWADHIVCDNPGCPMQGAYYGELIGRLGVGTPFRVGTTYDFTAPGSGALFLSVNDWSFKDNLGEFTVTVTVK